MDIGGHIPPLLVSFLFHEALSLYESLKALGFSRRSIVQPKIWRSRIYHPAAIPSPIQVFKISTAAA